jgi:hypothetical protein
MGSPSHRRPAAPAACPWRSRPSMGREKPLGRGDHAEGLAVDGSIDGRLRPCLSPPLDHQARTELEPPGATSVGLAAGHGIVVAVGTGGRGCLGGIWATTDGRT